MIHEPLKLEIEVLESRILDLEQDNQILKERNEELENALSEVESIVRKI